MAITEAQKWAIIGMHDSGKKIAEICATTKVERHQVSKILHSEGRNPTTSGRQSKITPEQKEQCIQMHKDGIGHVEIASSLKIGESTVRKILKEWTQSQFRELPMECYQLPLKQQTPREKLIDGLRMVIDALEEMEG